MENLAQGQVVAMDEHVGDRAQLRLGFRRIAERPPAEQPQAAETDHQACELRVVLHAAP